MRGGVLARDGPLCPSDISPVNGGNRTALPPRASPASVASLARVPLRFAKGTVRRSWPPSPSALPPEEEGKESAKGTGDHWGRLCVCVRFHRRGSWRFVCRVRRRFLGSRSCRRCRRRGCRRGLWRCVRFRFLRRGVFRRGIGRVLLERGGSRRRRGVR